MKVLHIGTKGNMEKYSPAASPLRNLDVIDLPGGLPVREYLDTAADASFIVVDAISPVTADLIDGMPDLRLIHSEGVAFNAIDLNAARARHVYVCNCAGGNAHAVAEQTLLLMVGMLRDVVNGDRAVREGRQIQVKQGHIRAGDIRELSDCAVGLVGFGSIGRAVAELLAAYGVEHIYYHKRRRLTSADEERYGVEYRSLPDLLSASDIVSLHLPVTDETRGMANAAFFSRMRDGSYLVNTSRGELVDDVALADALTSGKLAMAGIDTLDHEPVQASHPLLNLPEAAERRLILSPHIAGITGASFRRSYAMVWDDIAAVMADQVPQRVVNPW